MNAPKIITKASCSAIFDEIKDGHAFGSEKEIAWHITYKWCLQNGMKWNQKITGLENVIGFLEKLKNKKNG